MRKRIIALLMALVLAVGLLPAPAWAADEHSDHPVCGAVCGDDEHEDVTWEPWNGSGGLTSGSYYLTQDVTLGSTLKITGKVNLCLNGKEIFNEANTCIEVESGGTLNLCDCVGTGSVSGYNSGISNEVTGVVTVYGGSVIGRHTIGINNTGTLTVYGGSIIGSLTVGINNTGTLTVYDGSIKGFTPGISNTGVANVYGGSITGGTFGINNVGRVNTGDMPLETPTISGTLTISGSPVISGNNNRGLYVKTDAGATLENVKVDATGYTGGALGVFEEDEEDRYPMPGQESPIGLDQKEGSYAIKVSETSKDKFNLINEDFEYLYKDGGLVIHNLSAVHTHTWASAWTSDATHHWHECTADGCTVTENSEKDGYAAHSWNDGEVTTPPTGGEAGVRTYTCSVCEATRTEPIPALGYTVSGTVKDETGDPVEGATVKLKKEDGTVVKTTTTGTDGTYSIPEVEPGTYTIEISKGDLTGTTDVTVTDSDATVPDQTITPSTPGSGHTHAMSVGCETDSGDQVEFTEWKSGDFNGTFPSAPGNYALSEDVTIRTETWVISSGVVNLCLNGHTLNMTNGGKILLNDSSATLNICDCSEHGSGSVKSVSSRVNTYAEAIFISDSKSTLNLYGGNIHAEYTGTSGLYAYGVDADSAYINIYGGQITAKSSSTKAVALNISSNTPRVKIYGGILTANAPEGEGEYGLYLPSLYPGWSSYSIEGGVYIGRNSIGIGSDTIPIKVTGGIFSTDPTGVIDPSYTARKITSSDPGYQAEYDGYYVVQPASGPAPAHSHDGVEFTAWSDAAAMPTAAGNYCLTADVTLTDTWIVPTGETKLCLNGKVLKLSRTNSSATQCSVIKVPSGATLDLYDCDNTTKRYGSWTNGRVDNPGTYSFSDTSSDGAIEFTGGVITGGWGTEATINTWKNYRGGGVYVEGIFNLHSGNIAGNTLDGTNSYGNGAGVALIGSGAAMTMTGGRIADNLKGCGVGVYQGSTFTMSDGDIDHNLSGEGGGVKLTAIGTTSNSGGTMTMTGGAIHDNNRDNGVGGGILVGQASAFTMTGGSVTGNNGAVVLFNSAKSMALGGSIDISGNTGNDNNQSDIFLVGGYGGDCPKIQLNSGLTIASPIYVDAGSDWTGPTFTQGGIGQNYLTSFAAYDDSKEIVVNGNELAIQEKATAPVPHTHAWASAWTTSTTHHWHNCTAEGCDVTDNASKNGYDPHTPGDWIIDQAATTEAAGSRHKACSVCGYTTETETIPKLEPAEHSHVWATAWGSDSTHHWHECEGTGTCDITADSGKDGYAAHVYDDDADTSCNTCGYTRTVEPAEHTHAWTPAWTTSDTHHWHECEGAGTCDITADSGKNGYAAHSWNSGVVTTPPTGGEEGVRTYTCSVCEAAKTETIPALGFDISGQVTDSENMAVAGAKVTLKLGRTEVASTVTDARGNYSFTGVAPGSYNVVAEQANADGSTKTMTILVNITDANQSEQNLKMPSDNVNSVLKVEATAVTDATAEVSKTVVGGLEAEAEAQAQADETETEQGESKTVTVEMSVEAKTDAAANAGEIQGVATGKTLDYLEITVVKKVETKMGTDSPTTTQSTISTTTNLLTIVIPFNFSGKSEVVVYRHHGSAEEMTLNPASGSEGYKLDFANGLITIYAKNFSTYAIGYTEGTDSYTVTFDSKGGSAVASQTCGLNAKVVRPSDPTRSGYTFDGWYKDADCTAKWSFNSDTVTGDITLYAKWKENSSDPGTTPVTPPSTGDGGSGSGSASPTRYPVDVPASVPNGSVSISPANAGSGATVTITATPDEGYETGTVTVTDKDGKSVPVTDKGGGKYTFTMPAGKVTVSVSFVKAGEGYSACPKDDTCPIRPYTDASVTAWYHDGVHYCIENGLMSGYSGASFAPGDSTNRAMIATILWRLEGSPVVNYILPFDDVADGMWYTEAIRWAAANGVVNGYGDGKFGPGDPITREQLAAMLYRYEQYNGGGFTGAWAFQLDYADAGTVSDWAYEPMCWTTMNGIVNGVGDKRLDPGGSATRAQAATMIMRYCERS